ncbi:hypothetical protein SKAU_G00252850 [Synaphobranchus kaupii]|uniref:Uncharacterized protein n=1 Tax=Synaphobranchus kaupii TaxID=118154 RepID=A0A9Q1F3G6_SYNKA|nr:hypothetical protein SKAU_G00252850 [Synaphobranchus kaupii]
MLLQFGMCLVSMTTELVHEGSGGMWLEHEIGEAAKTLISLSQDHFTPNPAQRLPLREGSPLTAATAQRQLTPAFITVPVNAGVPRATQCGGATLTGRRYTPTPSIPLPLRNRTTFPNQQP